MLYWLVSVVSQLFEPTDHGQLRREFDDRFPPQALTGSLPLPNLERININTTVIATDPINGVPTNMAHWNGVVQAVSGIPWLFTVDLDEDALRNRGYMRLCVTPVDHQDRFKT